MEERQTEEETNRSRQRIMEEATDKETKGIVTQEKHLLVSIDFPH